MGALLVLGVLVSRISAFAADTNNNNNASPNQKTKYMLTSSDPIILKHQADALRAEADALRIQLDKSKEEAEQRRFECPMEGCDKAYSTSMGLYQHKRAKHPWLIKQRERGYTRPAYRAATTGGLETLAPFPIA